MATNSRPCEKQAASNLKLICSFCGKDQDQVRKLIAGPSVYICEECVDLCNEILDQECERETPAGQAPQQGTIFQLGASCALCHLPKPSEELLAVTGRGFICMVCLDAVRAAAEESEESRFVAGASEPQVERPALKRGFFGAAKLLLLTRHALDRDEMKSDL